MITAAAMRNGFTGGLIVDFPNSKKAKKYFLFLMAGYSEEIIKEAEEAIYLPKARNQGEDYNFADSSEDDDDADADEEGDSDMEEDEEEKKEDDGEDEESDDGFKKADKQIK